MTRSRRLYALVLSCVLAMTALLFFGAQAWATAAVHRTEARCDRAAAVAPVSRHERATHERASGSWRAHTLRLAGCGALRQVHDRMRHHGHGRLRRGA